MGFRKTKIPFQDKVAWLPPIRSFKIRELKQTQPIRLLVEYTANQQLQGIAMYY